MELKELFFKKLEDKCKEEYKSYLHDIKGCDEESKGKYYRYWFEYNNHELVCHTYEQFLDKFLDELMHCHGEVTFSVHSRFGN